MLNFFYNFENATNLKTIREGLNQNSEQLEQAFNYIPVEWFGLSDSNTPANNDVYMVQAMQSMRDNGHGLQFGIGEYQFSAEWLETNGDDFFAIRGINGLTRGTITKRTIIKRTTNKTLFTLNGDSLLAGNKLHSGAYISDIVFDGGDFLSDMFRCFSVVNMVWERITVRATTGIAHHLWEAFDSRFTNCVWEFIGNSDGSLPGVRLRSGAYDAGYGTQTRELTNEIQFVGCRMESYRGTAIDTVGSNTNEIYFVNCKFESLISNKKHLIFDSCSAIFFTNLNMYGVGDVGETIPSLLDLTNSSMIHINGFLEVSSVGADVTTLINVDDCEGVKIDLSTNLNSNKILSNYLINLSNLPTNSGYKFKMYNSNGVTKLLFDGTKTLYEIKNTSYVHSTESTDILRRLQKGGTTYNTKWDTLIQTDGDYTKYILQYDDGNGSTYTPFEVGGDGSTKLREYTLFSDRIRLGLLTATPFATDGVIYYDDNVDVKAERHYINGRWVRIGASPTIPTVTTGWQNGDIVHNTAPVAGGYGAWKLVSGAWKGWGLIEV